MSEAEIERLVELVLARLADLGVGDCPRCGTSCLPPPAPAPAPASAARFAAPQRTTGAEHADRLLSEDDVVRYHRSGVRRVTLPPRCLVTPAARDRARDLRIDIERDEA